ncbi:MAG: EAL domain-containing protein [Acidibacillus sp.]|nr:EAL domain-containing protein [Acidibacillus sp.]
MIKKLKEYFMSSQYDASRVNGQQVVATQDLSDISKRSLDEKRLMKMIDSSYDVFAIFSNTLEITYISSSIRNVLGYRLSDLRFSMWDIVHADDVESLQEKMREVHQLSETYVSIDVRMKHQNGEWRHCSITFRQLSDEPGMVIATLRDVTDIKRVQNLMVHQSYYDYITGLPNRKKFVEDLQLMVHRVKETNVNMAVMRLDIDHFKKINDTLGHMIGDKLLKALTHRLRAAVSNDIYFYRLSGDEFSFILIDYTHATFVLETVDKITESFKTSFQIDEFNLFVTASIGISLYPDDGQDSDTLFKNAGMALSRTKESNKNTYNFYTASLNTQSYKRFFLSNDFRNAMQKNQFVLYYQPRVDGRNGRIVGAEALIRWEHEEWGLVSPDDFISIAEENGLITPLGEWVLRTACIKLKEWLDKGLHVRLSVNFSIHQFLHIDIVDTVKRIVQETKVDVNFLEIEITESSLLPSGLVVYHAVKELRAMGIQVLFDDFGTGYSSLSWLNQLELDGLKIDKSFIQKISDNSTTLEIVRSIIKLAHGLNLSVIAEGVESSHEWDLLREEQCDEIQGYLFSRPLPADQFDQLLINEVMKVTEVSNYNDHVNRRQYFRVTPNYPIIATMTVSSIRGRLLHIGYSEVLIHDISAGGLSFISNLRFASISEVVLRFKVCVVNRYVDCDGKIVWSNELAGGIFQYGIQFIMSESSREHLIQDLNELTIQLKIKKDKIGEMKFFTENIETFFTSYM